MSFCKPVNESALLTDDDYGIYSSYLNGFSFYKHVPAVTPIILTDSTTSTALNIHPKTTWSWVTSNLGDRCKYLNDTTRCNKARDSAWASLFENVKQSVHQRQAFLLPSKLKVRYPLQLLSQFRKLHPDSEPAADSLPHYIFGVSRIAYSTDKTKALFFGSFSCGGTCGRGELIMLEKVDKAWILVDTFRFWIA
ncbi:hypothetical protein EXU85_27420 [Spirosoma sp. KCTC 42546]|uniref:hypothetical protein n=1 Tax=Spirosoma sp. KCTC 42546 TaxID=2520506 RepID=UPI00115B48E9|nr:hypothetical protein [Spirosoma sp. KCTC 42546]QDK82137.1 hypothetical protein EXU85_27420 [Spirosoma sp. KCTC 42546]